MYAFIDAVGSYLPKEIISNAELAKLKNIDTSDEWIRERTGICQRHIANSSETVVSMGVCAAKDALDKSSVDITSLQLIIVATCTHNKIFPSAASCIAQELGVENALTYDLQSACSGFLYSLITANLLIQSGAITNALVIGSEVMTSLLDWSDRGTCVLFGDGAGAVLLSKREKKSFISYKSNSDASDSEILLVHNTQACIDNYPYLQMQGPKLMKKAVNVLGKMCNQILSENNLSGSDVDYFIPHQANIRMIEATAKKIALPLDKIVSVIDKHANTSSASIPLALDYAITHKGIKRGDKILFEAIGGGLSWGASLCIY